MDLKIKKKRIVFLIIVVLLLTAGSFSLFSSKDQAVSAYTSTVYSGTNLSCYVTDQACPGVVIFNMSDYSGGHAEIPSKSNYTYKVCCTGTGIGNSCSATNHAVVLRLSNSVDGNSSNNGTDAHVEENTQSTSTYGSNQACISASASISCSYNTSCPAGSACLASISAVTNAHVASCDAYTTKVCCSTVAPANSCSAKVVSTQSVTKAGTTQLCTDADTTNSSDACYSACWTGTGTPDLTSSNWKCSTCKDNSNNTVSCRSLGVPFVWTFSGGNSSSSDYTVNSGSLSTYEVNVTFNAANSTRKANININSGMCTGSTYKPLPNWKEVSPF